MHITICETNQNCKKFVKSLKLKIDCVKVVDGNITFLTDNSKTFIYGKINQKGRGLRLSF